MIKNIKNYLQKDTWSPYIAGISIGTLAVFSIFVFKHTIGSSVAFVKISAFLWHLFSPQHVQNNIYYMSYLKNNAWLDWPTSLVIGTFLGAYLASKIVRKSNSTASLDSATSSPKLRLVKESCSSNTQNTSKRKTKRYLLSFLGGAVVLLGARFAGGCTSGHAISGGLQMAISSWLYMGGLFAVAIPSALIIHRQNKGS